MISTPGEGSAIRHGWSNHCFRNPVKPALHGRGLLSAADPMQWHSMVVKRNHTAQPGSFLQAFPNLTGSCPLLPSYLTDCSCPASHRTDRIRGPLHWLLCLLPQTWWEALRAKTDSYHVPLTLLWFWADCYDILVTNNTYFSPLHTSASGTTDMKKFVFSVQNWSSRLKCEWTEPWQLHFPNKSQEYTPKNSHAPKPSQQKHNVLFSTRKRGKKLHLIEKQKGPVSWRWRQICRHVYWQIVLLPGKYFSTKLVNVCSLCS